MCDFSLENYRSRKAKKGDRLVTYRFPTSTTGVCRLGEGTCPTCLQPGTELGFDKRIRLRTEKTLPYSVAVFVQLDHRSRTQHRDAIETPDGERYLLDWLDWGQFMEVLQLPAERPPMTIEAVAEELGLVDAVDAR